MRFVVFSDAAVVEFLDADIVQAIVAALEPAPKKRNKCVVL